MISKTLHYCWFGNNPKSKILLDCIQSWKQHCPDFEIKEWNENNTSQFANSFYKNALRKKKYAFVADYVRAKVLYEEGGVYLDTDMLLLKPIEPLLLHHFFIGEEVPGRVNFALFGAKKEHRFLKQMLDFYETAAFDVFSPPVITHTFSPIINKETLRNREIIVAPHCFYPLPYENRLEDFKGFVKKESFAVHLWEHSWANEPQFGVFLLIKNLREVLADYLFYNYSYAYFKRYATEFLRKLYHIFIGKNSLK